MNLIEIINNVARTLVRQFPEYSLAEVRLHVEVLVLYAGIKFSAGAGNKLGETVMALAERQPLALLTLMHEAPALSAGVEIANQFTDEVLPRVQDNPLYRAAMNELASVLVGTDLEDPFGTLAKHYYEQELLGQ